MEAATVIFRSAHPLVALRHKDGPPRGVSWGGMSFEPDENGVNWLPVEAVRELTESHGMVGAADAAPITEQPPIELPVTAAITPTQTKIGGAIRPVVFPSEGEHPEGGPQPALGPAPTEAEVLASASAEILATGSEPSKPSKK